MYRKFSKEKWKTKKANNVTSEVILLYFGITSESLK